MVMGLRPPRSMKVAIEVAACAVAVLVILALFAVVGCDDPPPHAPDTPKAWVTDRSGALSSQAWAAVDAQLEAYEKRTGHQVIVWIDRKLPAGTTVEAFGLLAFNAWGIGRKGHDDGVVLFVFVEDRAVRIQVGYGLERNLSDRVCARIIRDVIVPPMAKGDKDAAVTDGVAAILAAIEGNVSVEKEKP